MYSHKDLSRVYSMLQKIEDIKTVISRHGSITNALDDRAEARAAILMNLVAIAEQFDKLKKSESKILEIFDEIQIKGFYSIRTFIAHDYDGVSLAIIEDVLRHQIDILEISIKKLISE